MARDQKPLKLLFLTNRYPPYYTGGYEIACQAIAEQMRERGHTVRVLTSNFGLPETRVEGSVYRLLHRPQDTASLLQLARWELQDQRALRQLVEQWQPDVIYAWALLQLFPSLHRTLKSLGVPVVFNVQDIWIPTQIEQSQQVAQAWAKSGSNPLKNLVKSAIRTSLTWRHPTWLQPIGAHDMELSRLVFCSRFRQQQHIEMGFPYQQTTVIYNGIDVQHFSGEAKLPAADEILKILFVGRLTREKGPHTVIQALAELLREGRRNVRLTVVGVPVYPLEYAEELRRMASAAGPGMVNFIDNFPNQELPEVYRKHDVLVFSSIGPEGFPVTLLEAMACGVTVIGTTTGGSQEILEDGKNSLTFPPGDELALARRCRWVLENPEAARALARAGQQLVREKFNLPTIAAQTEEYLYSTLS